MKTISPLPDGYTTVAPVVIREKEQVIVELTIPEAVDMVDCILRHHIF